MSSLLLVSKSPNLFKIQKTQIKFLLVVAPQIVFIPTAISGDSLALMVVSVNLSSDGDNIQGDPLSDDSQQGYRVTRVNWEYWDTG